MKTSSKLCIERDIEYKHDFFWLVETTASKTVSSAQNRMFTIWCLRIADSLILSSHGRHCSPCTPTLAKWSRENLSFCRDSAKNTTSSRVFKRTNHVLYIQIYYVHMISNINLSSSLGESAKKFEHRTIPPATTFFTSGKALMHLRVVHSCSIHSGLLLKNREENLNRLKWEWNIMMLDDL